MLVLTGVHCVVMSEMFKLLRCECLPSWLIYRLNLKIKGSTEFITQRPWAVAPERSEGATKGLRVINYVEHVGFEV